MYLSALSAGAYTATLYKMVNRVKGGGRAHHQPGLIFSIMTGCAPEIGHCHSVCTLCCNQLISKLSLSRMRVLSKAFGRLKLTLPWVPSDTKVGPHNLFFPYFPFNKVQSYSSLFSVSLYIVNDRFMHENLLSCTERTVEL